MSDTAVAALDLPPSARAPFAPGASASVAGSGVPISIRGLVQRLGKQIILRGVDLDVVPGEFLTLLGASGSGKTTLLMAIAGFNVPDAGQILIAGQDVTAAPPHRRDIGIVFQSYALFPHMSVGRNVAYPLKMRGVGRADTERRVRQALDMVRLQGFEDRGIASLSGGQRQRAAVARAIVFHPRILLMDEPLSALDKPLRDAMQIELRRLHGALGLTTIYVTHDQREAITLSDRIAIMSAGNIVEIGTPKRLYEQPRSGTAARFLGESTIIPVEHGPGGITVHGQSINLASEATPGKSYGLLIRPEQLRLLSNAAPGPVGGVAFAGRVTDVIYEGGGFRLQILLDQDGATLSVRDPTLADGAVPQPGSAVVAGLAANDLFLLALDP